jgi:hypothetical protein
LSEPFFRPLVLRASVTHHNGHKCGRRDQLHRRRSTEWRLFRYSFQTAAAKGSSFSSALASRQVG